MQSWDLVGYGYGARTMKIIGLMLARNEGWVIGCSARVALKWCDELVVGVHACKDATVEILQVIEKEAGKPIWYHFESDHDKWDEMHHRDRTLQLGRERGGTHFAIVDADEVLTANNLPNARMWFDALAPGQCIDVPMVPTWKSLDRYNANIHSVVTLGFKDSPKLCWKPRGDEQYHHHSRPPMFSHPQRLTVPNCEGGVFHLQFAAWERFIEKHRHYMMSERVRWGYPAREINEKYHWFEKIPFAARDVPSGWWEGLPRHLIQLDHHPWYRDEVARMLVAHPAGTFAGLDLFGLEAP